VRGSGSRLSRAKRAVDSILDCPDQHIREAALRDWPHTQQVIVDALTAYLVKILAERQDAEGRLQ
jgi:hypothetical protein